MLGILFYTLVAVDCIGFALLFASMAVEGPEIDEELQTAKELGEEPLPMGPFVSGCFLILLPLLLTVTFLVGMWWGVGPLWALAAVALSPLIGGAAYFVFGQRLRTTVYPDGTP